MAVGSFPTMSGFSHSCAGKSCEFSGKLPFSGLNLFFSVVEHVQSTHPGFSDLS